MRAAVVDSSGKLGVATIPDPEPGPHEAVVRVELCGICGSDIHTYKEGRAEPGCVLGHEFCGTIAAVGAEVTNVREGDRVAVFPAWRCGTCAACRRGASVLLCDLGLTAFLGSNYNRGGYAEYCVAPSHLFRVIPPEMTWQQASLVEPYAVAVHARERSRVGRFGADKVEGVGIVGGGPIGLMVVASLRAKGVETIYLGEPRERRAEVARMLRATSVAPSLAEAIGDAPLPELVFDCSGAAVGPELAVASVRKGGEVMMVALQGEEFRVPARSLMSNEIDVFTSITYTEEEFDRGLAEVLAATWDTTDVISGHVPLEGAREGIDDLLRSDGPVKLQISPWS